MSQIKVLFTKKTKNKSWEVGLTADNEFLVTRTEKAGASTKAFTWHPVGMTPETFVLFNGGAKRGWLAARGE